jgi:DDE superfamily endonuclease
VLVIDETGARKDGHHTAHVGRQYLANLGKIDHGVVSVTSLWADERVYYPVDVEPYTPAHHFAKGKKDPQCGHQAQDRCGAGASGGAGSHAVSCSGGGLVLWRGSRGQGGAASPGRGLRAGPQTFPRLVASGSGDRLVPGGRTGGQMEEP